MANTQGMGKRRRWLYFLIQQGQCFTCGGEMDYPLAAPEKGHVRGRAATIEHLISYAHQPKGPKWARVLACETCNAERGAVGHVTIEERDRAKALYREVRKLEQRWQYRNWSIEVVMLKVKKLISRPESC